MHQYNQEEITINCPYCGASIQPLIDYSSGEQRYYEDCSVCCAPILFLLTINEMDGELYLQIKRDDE